MNTINVIATLFLIAVAVSVVMTMKAINRNTGDEKRKNKFFVALIIFQLTLAAFIAINI